MTYFNEYGRRVNSGKYRVFSEEPQNYYKIAQPKINYEDILKNSIQFGGVNPTLKVDEFKSSCLNLEKEIKSNADFANLFKGTHIPFIAKKIDSTEDLGGDLETFELPNFQKAFNHAFPSMHFKATLQSDSKLPANIKLDSRSRYDAFVESLKKGAVVGWYFPQALQEFDIESQRQQMVDLPILETFCLSGGIDILAALIGSPDLLVSKDFYSPILCLSSYVHMDPRLVLLLKSYGPHMEFWCMTQMLTKNTTQVSEQWAGGITFFTEISQGM